MELIPEIKVSALDARSALTSAAIAAAGTRQFEELKMAAVSLVDAFGTLHDSARDAVPWLLLLQSLSARKWLLGTWKTALNPTCEVYASLIRLEDLEAAHTLQGGPAADRGRAELHNPLPLPETPDCTRTPLASSPAAPAHCRARRCAEPEGHLCVRWSARGGR